MAYTRDRLIEGSTLPIVVMEAKGLRFVDCNAAAVAAYGFSTAEEVLGKTALEVSAETQYDGNPTIEHVPLRLAQALSSGAAVFEWRHRRPDGTIWDAEVHLMRLTLGADAIFQLVLIDITARRQAEAALRDRESDHRFLFQYAAVPILILDAAGRFIDCNPRAEELFERSRSEITRVPPWTLSPPHQPNGRESKDYGCEKIDLAFDGKSQFFEWVHLRKDGTPFEAEVSLSAHRSAHGNTLIAFIQDISERKQAERDLAESQALYHAVIDSTDDLIWSVDPLEFRLMSFNKGLFDHFQSRSVSLTIGQRFEDLFSADYAAKWRLIFQNTIREGSFSAEYQTSIRNRILWIRTHLISRDGKPFAISVFGRDITDQKRAETEALKQQRFDAVMSDLLGRIIRSDENDLDSIIESGMGAVTNLLGADLAHMLRRDDDGTTYSLRYEWTSHHTASRKNLYQRVPFGKSGWSEQQILAGRSLIVNDTENASEETESSKQRWRELGYKSFVQVPYTGKGGIILGNFGLFSTTGTSLWNEGDVRRLKVLADAISNAVERNKAEQELKESEARFRQIADNVQEVFFLYEKADRKLLYLSPVAERVFGAGAIEVFSRSRNLDEVAHPDDAPRVVSMINDRFYAMPLNEEFRIVRRDGEIRWVRMRSFLINNDKGEVARVAGLVSDITDLKVAEEQTKLHQMQLIQAAKMASLGLLVSGIGHEINNPTNIISLNAPMLRKAWQAALPVVEQHIREVGDLPVGGMNLSELMPNILPLIDGISNGARRIQRIVNDLKDYARSDSGRPDRKVDLNEAVKSALSLMNHHIRKSTESFSVKLSETPLPVMGNHQRLEQVIVNLLQNACDALPSSEKRLSISSFADLGSGKASIIIEDQGEGIAPEDLLRITDPFFTTKRDRGGTGLGLSVSAGIIKDHEGQMRFDSVVGKGTTVTIEIPLSADGVR